MPMLETSKSKEKPQKKGGLKQSGPQVRDFPQLLDDEVEGGRVVQELHYVLTKIDGHSQFVDNLVDAANDYGGPAYRKTIELLDGRGSYSAEEIVSAVILAVAGTERLLPFEEEKRVSEGILPKADIHYLSELRRRFGTPEKMSAIAGRLNQMQKIEIKEFLDQVRDDKKQPAKVLYEILMRKG